MRHTKRDHTPRRFGRTLTPNPDRYEEEMKFLAACEEAGVEPTTRQWKKWRRGIGSAKAAARRAAVREAVEQLDTAQINA